MKNLGLFTVALLLVGGGCFSDSEVSDDLSPLIDPVVEDLVEVGELVALEPEDVSASVTIVDETNIKRVEMKSGNFFFEPASIATEAGQMVEITFAKNTGSHTFVIDEIGLKETVEAGGTIIFQAPTQGGEYEFYCDVGNHRAQGMVGILHNKEL